MTSKGFFIFLLLAGIIPFLAKRLLRYLHLLQLEEYDIQRFLSLLWKNKIFDTRGTLVFAIAIAFLYVLSPILSAAITSFVLLLIAFFEPDPRKLAKVPLKFTERAKRIYICALVATLCFEAISLPFTTFSIFLAQILIIQATPFFLSLACLILRRDEHKRQHHFQEEAKRILHDVNPFIIGITGSYGKTSTKDALSRILQVSLGPTFWTPKSINTVMGITREIRNNLKKGTEYAVMEMGAYSQGSIDRLCRLTPPLAALITCVGVAHLERFKTPENIFKAKSELAKNVPYSGILVCNGDDVGARRIAEENPKSTVLLYGLHPEKARLDVWMSDDTITTSGTEFVIHWKGKDFKGFTPLLGKTALSNLLGAFTMACALGANPALVIGVMRNLQPVDNRLEIKKERGITYLRDAYNSNPAGFKSALDVLAALPTGRKIVMTPGMIELGNEQAFHNEEIGNYAAGICDVALIVGNTNREAIERGIKKGRMSPDHIYFCTTREEAFSQLRHLAQEGDNVLIENDLTDIYATPTKF